MSKIFFFQIYVNAIEEHRKDLPSIREFRKLTRLACDCQMLPQISKLLLTPADFQAFGQYKVANDNGHSLLWNYLPEEIKSLKINPNSSQIREIIRTNQEKLLQIESITKNIHSTWEHENSPIIAILPVIKYFKNLKILSLTYLKITGEIPKELWKLTNLEQLHLVNNSMITGVIPKEIGNLINLKSLYLAQNKKITGEIPKEIGNLTKMQLLSLNVTMISGRIPKEIGNLTNLQLLDLSFNSLTGEIPKEIGNLTSLKELYLGYNRKISGEIPKEIGNLTNLTGLHLNDNMISGEIPKEIGNLTNLTVLQLEKNMISGKIPNEINKLTKLNCFFFEKK